MRPSDQVLRNLASALCLTDAETAYLFSLAGRLLPPTAHPSTEIVSPALRRLLAALEPHPAYIANRRWDGLARNRAADALFSFEAATAPHPRNLLCRFFTQPKPAQVSLQR